MSNAIARFAATSSTHQDLLARTRVAGHEPFGWRHRLDLDHRHDLKEEVRRAFDRAKLAH
jgi:hypothetical protein